MRILLLTHRVPFPPDRGDRIRSYHLLRYLSERADVSLASTTDEATPSATRDELDRLCQQVAIESVGGLRRSLQDAASVLVGRSATEGHFWSKRLATTVSRWANEQAFDAVVCFCSGMFRYAKLPALCSTPTVVDLVDVDSEKWAQCAASSQWPKAWLHRIESARVRNLERSIANQAGEVMIISESERDLCRAVTGRSNVRVAGNGVDTVFFNPDETASFRPNSCCFVGVLNYQPNVDGLRWFATHVWPRVIEMMPDATFQIVGRKPTPAVRELESEKGVTVHADVPDVRPFLAESAVAIAPLQIARGVQNKVLEAMAMALPVVATPAALTGIEARPNEDALVADSPDEWLSAIQSVWSDSHYRHQVGSAARCFVRDRHSWSQTLRPFGDVLGLGVSASEPSNFAHVSPALATAEATT